MHVKDRVNFTLARYFRTARLQQIIYFSPEILESGFVLDSRFAEAFFEDNPMNAGEERTVKIEIEGSIHNATLQKHVNGNLYKVLYNPTSRVPQILKNALTPLPEKGEKAFKIIAEKKCLKINMAA
jgi:hypothetical protein